MRVRRERMLQHYNECTYRAIEAENARKAMAEREKRANPGPVKGQPERPDPRDPVEIAKAASRALRGEG